jgi:hypothetical protein
MGGNEQAVVEGVVSGRMNSPFDLFICYRRASSDYPASDLYRILVEGFGETVFIDHECLRGGENWRNQIESVIERADTMIVLLAPNWLSDLKSRAESDSSDEVLRELTLALQHNTLLYPVLLQGTSAPKQRDAHDFAPESDQRKVVLALANAQYRHWRPANDDDLRLIIDELADHLPRFPERLRARCTTQLHGRLTAGDESDTLRLKLIPLAHPIDRPRVRQSIRESLARRPAVLVIHADEGMGKTMAMIWAAKELSRETVFVCDAVEITDRIGLAELRKSLLERLGLRPKEIALAKREPLIIVIDGLNEAPGPHWTALIRDVLNQNRGHEFVRLIVTVRSGYWRNEIFPNLQPLAVAELQVPPLDDSEFRALSRHIGFDSRGLSPKVVDQLRKPRMLVAANGIPPDQLEGVELTYALLQLLDLKQRGSKYRVLSLEHFDGVLRGVGRAMKARSDGLKRSELHDLLGDLSAQYFEQGLHELCDAGVLRRQPGGFAADENSVGIALGLHLLNALRETKLSDVSLLSEQICTEIADAQDDLSGQIIANALTVGLIDRIHGRHPPLDQPDPLLIALLRDLERRYNARSTPARMARWLLPELVWMVEQSASRDAERLLTQAWRHGSRSPWHSEFSLRLRRWFSGIDPTEGSFTGPASPDRLAARRALLKQAQAISALREVGRAEARLRRVGLRLLAEVNVSPHGIPLSDLILGVAAQPAGGWDALAYWARSSGIDWWPALEPVWRHVETLAPNSPLLFQLAKLMRHVWPTPECRSVVGEAPERNAANSDDYDHLDRLRTLTSPAATPSPSELETLDRRTDPSRRDLRRLHDHASYLALWMPDRLQGFVDEWAAKVAQNAPGVTFPGGVLGEFAPLVSPPQARRVRAALPWRGDLQDNQRSLLSLVSWWTLPSVRQAVAVLRHLGSFDPDADMLRAVPLGGDLAVALVRRMRRSHNPEVASRIAFWLLVGLNDQTADALRSALPAQLSGLEAQHLTSRGQYWLLQLCLRLELPEAVLPLIPATWCYEADQDSYIRLQYARSAVMARSGGLDTADLRERCHPNHWHYAKEPERSVLLSERAFSVYAEFGSAGYKGSANNHRLSEMAYQHPEIIAQILVSMNPRRSSQALELAMALTPNEHPRWLDLVEVIAFEPLPIGTRIDGLDERLRIAFTIPDSDRARAIWDRLLNQVEHDADLLDLVIAAQGGSGHAWLSALAATNSSAEPQQQLRAATIAGMAMAMSQRDEILAARDRYEGWIRKGLELALSHYDRAELAQAWYRRFRTASNWFEAYGCWQMHLQQADLRLRTWKLDAFPAHALADAARYEIAFRSDVREAINRRGNELKKTRFGMEQP